MGVVAHSSFLYFNPQLLLSSLLPSFSSSHSFPFKFGVKMSSSRPSQSSSNSGRSRHSARVLAQTTVDAKLHATFEESGSSFDYSSSVRVSGTADGVNQPRSDKVTTAYLHHIQRGKMIQPFGCLLALDEKTCKVIAYSENAPEMLTMVSHAVPSVGDHPALGIGSDIKTLFTAPSASALQKALGFGEVSLLNPILVHCKTSGKPFYAIIHRVTGSLIIDFEPVKPYEVPMTAAGALQSYKLAAKAITRLQSLPSGSMDRLCDTMVQEVFELTGYDRVMAYKFHEDDHGEVIAEITKPGLEPYLGLHYPATDIPQASRFLFMKNKVRMIVDCYAKHVKVLQDEKLPFDLTLCGSTLRAPHSCHAQYMANMDSIASLVMAVVVNDNEEDGDTDAVQPQKRKRLWGLVVCHNTTPRFVPFPLRYACEFLAQVFAIHVNKEIELEYQIIEKNILRTQTLLCDMLMRDAPLGIVSQSPNIMDLVKCDGAALLYKNKVWRLGVTPSESQIREIALWLSEYHMDSTGLSTDSLSDAGYPSALSMGDVVCGMAAVRITSKDVVFWFRSHTAAEIRWGGAKHEVGEKDDGRRMHPRSSFKAFLQVVKARSLPWKDYEMDAIHSLQLILRNAFKDTESTDLQTNVINTKLSDLKIEGMQELEAVTSEMVRLIETATVPILAVDVDGLVNGWNIKVAELTGLPVGEAIGKHLLTLVEDSSTDRVKKMLDLALLGDEEKNVQFEIKTFGSKIDSGPITPNFHSSLDTHYIKTPQVLSMSASCGVVECVFVLGCARWLWKRCTYVGSYDSATWPAATADEFDPVPRVCRLILANYDPDLRNPQYYKPAPGHRLNPDWVVKRVTHEDTLGCAPPYLIYLDHEHKEIVLAVRGLNLANESDYKVLLDNRLGQQMFDGGYVHRGLLKSAVWLLNRESETLKQLWVENGSEYEMVFAGHSLGSGVVSLLTILVVNHRDRLGGIPKEKIRCYALAPARCMSLNLAVKYANVIHSVVLQDDFLPRTPTPLEDIFKSIFCLPCLLFFVCLRDTFIPEGRKLRDTRRLYVPGRMYHIVERKFCRCGRFPPEVRTAIPVDGRFEHIVLSCNATSDHGIIWIEREAEKALQLMKEQRSETVTVPPTVQKFERLKTIEKEHRDALERAVSLNVPHAVETAEEEASEKNEGEEASGNGGTQSLSNWDQVVEKLLKKSNTGEVNNVSSS